MGREAAAGVGAMLWELLEERMKLSEECKRCSAAHGSQEGSGCSVSGAHLTPTSGLKHAKSIMMEREAAAKLGAVFLKLTFGNGCGEIQPGDKMITGTS